MSNTKSKRKKTYVDRNVQGALVRRLAMHWLLFLLVGTGVSLAFQVLTDPFTSFRAHITLFLKHQSGFLAVMVCMSPIFLYDTVKLSHRFAGPILRLRRSLHDMAEGREVERVHFRPGDFWTELADDFNAIVDRQRLTTYTEEGASPTQAQGTLRQAADTPAAVS